MRRVFITGASTGIGAALARHYAGAIDAQSTDSAIGLFARYGAPDLVIANAGVSVGTHGDELQDVEKLRRVLDVNVAGLAAACRWSPSAPATSIRR